MSRQLFWRAALILIAINALISIVVYQIFGLGLPGILGGLFYVSISSVSVDPIRELLKAQANLVIFVLLLYPTFCITIKRRHDCNNNGLDLILYLIGMTILLAASSLPIGVDAGIATNTDLHPSLLALVILLFLLPWVGAAYCVYVMMMVGFREGTPGQNAYGDPAPTSARTALSGG